SAKPITATAWSCTSSANPPASKAGSWTDTVSSHPAKSGRTPPLLRHVPGERLDLLRVGALAELRGRLLAGEHEVGEVQEVFRTRDVAHVAVTEADLVLRAEELVDLRGR